ncbi:MAG: TetR/AcrR family transcriptional regulator [Alphaproteobacteria bacterium]|nr:TetR/AcrR family transcriptional regulator [Alphaproteobacteria bacterium]
MPKRENLPPAKKQKGARREAAYRRPSRQRGVVRYHSLLEATEELLQTYSPDAIGLYQIAERAGCPPASVYHFFPTKESAYQALAERYLEEMLDMHATPVDARLLHSWQDLLTIGIRRGAEFSNERPPMLKILYGGYGGVEARNLDDAVTGRMAGVLYERFNMLFHMPAMRNPYRCFRIMLGILDAIWMISVRQTGRITEEYLDETNRACVGYLRLYLPEVVEPRDSLIEAAVRGDALSVPYFFKNDE